MRKHDEQQYQKRLQCRREILAKFHEYFGEYDVSQWKDEQPAWTTTDLMEFVWGDNCPYSSRFVGQQLPYLNFYKITRGRVYMDDGTLWKPYAVKMWTSKYVGLRIDKLL